MNRNFTFNPLISVSKNPSLKILYLHSTQKVVNEILRGTTGLQLEIRWRGSRPQRTVKYPSGQGVVGDTKPISTRGRKLRRPVPTYLPFVCDGVLFWTTDRRGPSFEQNQRALVERYSGVSSQNDGVPTSYTKNPFF